MSTKNDYSWLANKASLILGGSSLIVWAVYSLFTGGDKLDKAIEEQRRIKKMMKNKKGKA